MKRTSLFVLGFLILFLVFTLTLTPGIGSGRVQNYLHLPVVLRGWPPPPLPGRLVVSEILYDPTGKEPDGEWVEVYNQGGSLLSLNSYKIGDEESLGDREGMLEFPPGVKIGPGETLVIASQGLVFFNTYGFLPDFEIRESDPGVPNLVKYTAWSGGNIELSNGGDEVLILNESDQVVDVVSWGSSVFAFDPSAPVVKDGQSIERVPVTQDTDSAIDWKPQSIPQPGQVVYPTETPTLTPSATSTSTSTETPTATSTETLTITPTVTHTTTPTVTSTVTQTPTSSATASMTPTSTGTQTPTSTASLTATASTTITPTWTLTASATASKTATATSTTTATATGSATPTRTNTPTSTNTITPSPTPTLTQTLTPTSTASATPTHTPTPPSGDVRLLISEILYDSTCSTDANCEWVEIYNAGSSPVDLSSYKIGDEETQASTEGMLQFPQGTSISPGEVLVIVNKAVDFINLYGFAPDFELYGEDPNVPNLTRYSFWASGSVQFNNDGDEVILLGPTDLVVDALNWGTSTVYFNPSALDVAAGHSLQRSPADQDTNSAADWIDQASPAPGTLQ